MKGHLERTVTLSAGAILALALSLGLSWGLDRLLPPDTWPTGALPLIFLMHGVTVIAAWLYRWASVLYIAPGLVIGGLLFGQGLPVLDPTSVWVVAATSLAVAPLGFAMMDWAGIGCSPSQRLDRKCWRVLVLAGLKASFFGYLLRAGLAKLTAAEAVLDAAHAAQTMLSEMLGLMTMLVLLMLVFRWSRAVAG
jgi:hypothetical protein